MFLKSEKRLSETEKKENFLIPPRHRGNIGLSQITPSRITYQVVLSNATFMVNQRIFVAFFLFFPDNRYYLIATLTDFFVRQMV